MNVKQLLPKDDKQLIITALKSYQATIKQAIDRHNHNGLGDVLSHDIFDLTGLIGMMNYDVEIALPKSVKDRFASKHGVDFPEYCEDVMAKYPIESEWVTVIKGTISFTDDGVHGREASIQNVVGTQKYLRNRVDEEIICIEEAGYDYIVVEDYDGLIEFDIVAPKAKDKRVFQVIDVCGSYTVTQSFDEVIKDGGMDSGYRDLIDALGSGETLEVHKEEVYIIRIK